MAETVDLVQATWVPAANAVRGQLRQQGYGRRVKLMSIRGPANSTLTIYRGGIPNFAGAITSVFPADVRTFDAATDKSGIDIRPGEVATFDWTGGSSGVGQTAACNLVSEVYA
jgi:hypothetical protein